ncbi:uncharacterized protein MONOS_16723 [Monocercomonoides exilis]|uniref:uncharacterized protein n=1 Tax=Monocercomonoides exilis TaxID=2049356 RepID=UPI00355A237C|nr:hypothetical protein MONOS_16723 [Monocercomonoides exilis]|eukprot:MONOS_16723.1-p1 / transcript=MONOS_16723.1 / gene=MONOS_16723 / organism=Monocercomonoides_exilis_PA203 / gene_product=unspecified product / transcript_product=unspecified product / location=Mono_scaffold02071:963-1364(+) / protein_length=112 / sequence_SO=supercontig / SO=protein_coding / is_pseudo=false
MRYTMYFVEMHSVLQFDHSEAEMKRLNFYMMMAVEMSVLGKKQSKSRQEVEMNENERKRDISLCRVANELSQQIHMESAQGEGIRMKLEMIFSGEKQGYFSMRKMEFERNA